MVCSVGGTPAMDNIVLLIGLLYIANLATSDNATVFISVQYNSGESQLKRIQGNPDDWIKALRETGTVKIDSISGTKGVISFGKLAAYYRSSALFYSDRIRKTIVQLYSVSTTPTLTYQFASDKIGGVTVDWISKNVYWTDQVYNSIMMVPVERTTSVPWFFNFLRIIDTDLDMPGNVRVDPRRSFLFWTDIGKIERSDLLGRNRTIIVSDVTRPITMAIDYKIQQIYWVDFQSNFIRRSDYNGDNRNIFLQQDFISDLVGMSIFKDYMFAVDGTHHLYFISIPVKSFDEVKLNSTIQETFDIVVLPENPQTFEKSPCDSAGCSNLCVGTDNNTHYECTCPWKKYLVSSKTCEDIPKTTPVPPVYMFVEEGSLYMYNVWLPDFPIKRPISYDKQIAGDVLAPDFHEGIVFIGGQKSITKLHLPSGNASVIFTGKSNINALAVDWVSKHLYWSNDMGQILSATTEGLDIKTLPLAVQTIKGLAVDPLHGYIYWTYLKGISRAKGDGSENVTFVEEDVESPGPLVIDFHENRLYWADGEKKTIESIDINGENRSSFQISEVSITDLAVYQDYVVWTYHNHSKQGVGWSNKNGIDSQGHKDVTLGHSIILYGKYSQPFTEVELKDTKDKAAKTTLESGSNKKTIIIVICCIIGVIVICILALVVVLARQRNRGFAQSIQLPGDSSSESLTATGINLASSSTYEALHYTTCHNGDDDNASNYNCVAV